MKWKLALGAVAMIVAGAAQAKDTAKSPDSPHTVSNGEGDENGFGAQTLVLYSTKNNVQRRLLVSSWGDTKLNFADEMDKIENDAPSVNLLPDAQIVQQALDNQPINDRFQALMAISPNAAIMDSWRGIEQSIQDLVVGLSP